MKLDRKLIVQQVFINISYIIVGDIQVEFFNFKRYLLVWLCFRNIRIKKIININVLKIFFEFEIQILLVDGKQNILKDIVLEYFNLNIER